MPSLTKRDLYFGQCSTCLLWHDRPNGEDLAPCEECAEDTCQACSSSWDVDVDGVTATCRGCSES